MIIKHEPVDYFATPQAAPVYSEKSIKFVALILFFVFLFLLKKSTDESAFLYLNDVLNTLLPHRLWAHITDLGNGAMAGTLLLWLAHSKPQTIKRLLLTILATGITIAIFKQYFSYSRPAGVLDANVFTIIGDKLLHRSFPSGHTATAFSAAGFIWASFNFKQKYLVLLIAILVGLSRIAVGAHFPKDVALGALLGWMMGYLCARMSTMSFSSKYNRVTVLFLCLVAASTLIDQENEFEPMSSITVVRTLAFLSLLWLMVQYFKKYGKWLSPRLSAWVRKNITWANENQQWLPIRFLKFGFVGFSGFLVDSLVFFFAQSIGFTPNTSRAISYWFAATNNWFFNRIFTFGDAHKEKKGTQWMKYIAMTMVSFCINWGTFYVLTENSAFMKEHNFIPFIIGIAFGMAFNFTVANWVIFKRPDSTPPKGN